MAEELARETSGSSPGAALPRPRVLDVRPRLEGHGHAGLVAMVANRAGAVDIAVLWKRRETLR